MSKIFCALHNGRIKNRIVFDSYESAEKILGTGNFVEETEETGPLFIGGLWDGNTCIPATEEELAEFQAELISTFIVEEPISQPTE